MHRPRLFRAAAVAVAIVMVGAPLTAFIIIPTMYPSAGVHAMTTVVDGVRVMTRAARLEMLSLSIFALWVATLPLVLFALGVWLGVRALYRSCQPPASSPRRGQLARSHQLRRRRDGLIGVGVAAIMVVLGSGLVSAIGDRPLLRAWGRQPEPAHWHQSVQAATYALPPRDYRGVFVGGLPLDEQIKVARCVRLSAQAYWGECTLGGYSLAVAEAFLLGLPLPRFEDAAYVGAHPAGLFHSSGACGYLRIVTLNTELGYYVISLNLSREGVPWGAGSVFRGAWATNPFDPPTRLRELTQQPPDEQLVRRLRPDLRPR